MRFAPEGDHGANAGLKAARDFLEPVKGKGYRQSVLQQIDKADRAISLDNLLRPLDSRRRLRHPGNARPRHPLATGPNRS